LSAYKVATASATAASVAWRGSSPRAIRHSESPGRTTITRVGSVGLIVPDTMVDHAVAALGDRPLAVVGTTDRDEVEFDIRLDVVPASLAKGLEFDHVVLVEPAAIVAAESDDLTGLRRLYVCLTRAVTSLVVLHSEPLPEPLH
jgi:hypothetical protein